jgi:NADH-quinone oxidoreductase subunit E
LKFNQPGAASLVVSFNFIFMRIDRISPEKTATLQDQVDLNLLDPVISRYRGKKGSLIPLLQGAQDVYGYIPRAVFEKLSAETGIKLSDMFGVATFYAQFRLNPVGKHIIKVCHGTACHVQNANIITEALQESLEVKDGETTDDRLFTLESVACLGCCSLAPVMMIGEETYGKLTGSAAVKIVKNIKLQELQ